MNCRPILLLAALALLPGLGRAADAAVETKKGPAAAAAATPATSKAKVVAPAAATSDNYRLVWERNIFNSNRIGRTRNTDTPAPRTDMISFVGTMETAKGLLVFFDSPDSAYRKTVPVGGAVGKFTVKAVTPTSVDLEREGKPLTLNLGAQLRRPEGGEWTVIASDIVRSEQRAAEAAAATPSPTTPMAIPADASEALRRLMEKRQQQLKQ